MLLLTSVLCICLNFLLLLWHWFLSLWDSLHLPDILSNKQTFFLQNNLFKYSPTYNVSSVIFKHFTGCDNLWLSHLCRDSEGCMWSLVLRSSFVDSSARSNWSLSSHLPVLVKAPWASPVMTSVAAGCYVSQVQTRTLRLFTQKTKSCPVWPGSSLWRTVSPKRNTFLSLTASVETSSPSGCSCTQYLLEG